MSQRVGVLILASFVTCFVGSCAVGSRLLLQGVVDSLEHPAPPTVSSSEPSEEPASTEPLVMPEAPQESGYDAPRVATAQFAVFHFGGAKKNPLKTLNQLVKGTGLAVYSERGPNETLPAGPPYLVARVMTIDEYPPGSVEAPEESRWLTPALKKALKTSKEVTVIDAVLPQHGDSLSALSKVMLGLAQATGGVLWDGDSQDFFSQDEWKARRVVTWEKTLPEALMHYTVYTDAAEGTVDLKTAGLNHLGLPEVELRGAPLENQPAAIALLNVVVQLLVEAGTPPQPGPMKVRLDGIQHRVAHDDAVALATDDAVKELDVILVGTLDEKGPVLELTFDETSEAAITTLFGTQAAEE